MATRNPDKTTRRTEVDSDKKPHSMVHDQVEQANADITDSQQRSDTLASKTGPHTEREEAAGRGVVDNMNIDPIDELEETDEVSGPPGESVPHEQPKPLDQQDETETSKRMKAKKNT
jgi:hypothetical protein